MIIMTNTERLTVTIPEVAKALGISRGLAYELAKRDKLPIPIIRLGQKRMCASRRALENLLSGGQAKEDPESRMRELT